MEPALVTNDALAQALSNSDSATPIVLASVSMPTTSVHISPGSSLLEDESEKKGGASKEV